jgi:GcvH upstream region-like protein
MFAFIRKYQRYLFIIVSAVIIVSFSFFGTYNTLPTENLRSQTAFTAVDGSSIPRSELDEMVLFLSTDTEDKNLYGGVWGPNFLNDGVIKKDFLQTGLGGVIAAQFSKELEIDLSPRLTQEKRFTPYSHPEASFVSAESIWSYAAPEIKKNFDTLRKGKNPTDLATFNARVGLYLNEKKLPQQYLKQFLRYQEQQYPWLKPDPNLERIDLSLFGYHNLNDWFGQRFVGLLAEFIINSAKTAEAQGYRVSAEEALTELNNSALASYQLNARNPHLGVTNSEEYFNEQLRLMGMDQRMAVKVWQNVMLFRRLFHEAGESVFVDPLTFNGFVAYAKESVEGELYQLPKELKLGDFTALQKFEVYLNAVAKQQNAQNPLELPLAFKSVADVKKKNPELVQKRYLLQLTEVDKNALQAKVGIKETWNWEVDDTNWKDLKKKFPDITAKDDSSKEGRYEALDSLNKQSRSKIDTSARNAIVESHPEWIEQALEHGSTTTIETNLSAKRGSSAFKGLEDGTDLMTLLDNPDSKESVKKLSAYTADQQHYYKIIAITSTPDEEIMTFAEANQSGALEKILNTQLKSYYESNREANAGQFQRADKSWKPFDEVKDQVAALYFAKQLQAIKTASGIDSLSGEKAAPLRLQSYVQMIRDAAEKDPSSLKVYVQAVHEKPGEGELAARKQLPDQWKIEKLDYKSDRSSKDDKIAIDAVLTGGEWSAVKQTPTGAIYFLRKIGSKAEVDQTALNDKIDYARRQLSNEAQSTLGQSCAIDWKAKKALSLDYLQTVYESIVPED